MTREKLKDRSKRFISAMIKGGKYIPLTITDFIIEKQVVHAGTFVWVKK